MFKSGIYTITNKTSNKVYVGSSVDLQKRNKDHFSYLRANTHHNIHLQRAFNKYGESSFVFDVVKFCPDDAELLIILEKEEFGSHDFEELYNIVEPGPNPMHNREFTEEHKEKISKALKEYNKKFGNTFKGKKHSVQSRKRMSESQKAYCKKEGNSFLGKKHTKASKKKMSRSITKYVGINKVDRETGKVLGTYYNASEALKHSDNPEGFSGNILAVCKFNQKTAYGYI